MTIFSKNEPMLARLDAAIADAQLPATIPTSLWANAYDLNVILAWGKVLVAQKAAAPKPTCPYCGLTTDEACGSLPVSLGCTREYYSRY